MKLFIIYFISIIILFPFIPFVITFFLCKRRNDTVKSFGIAADITTIFLLFSVPLIIKGIWDFGFTWIMFAVLIIIGIVLTYIDWRTKKEIEIFPLLKKIWRMYFIFLSVLYILIWIIGLIISTLDYVYK